MTEQLYYSEPYNQVVEATVLSCLAKGNQYVMELSATNFYPQGGGQPSDQGEIVGLNGRMKVELVHLKDGHIIHQGKMMGKMTEGDEVSLHIKWSHRHLSMRLHTAGHAIHDAVMQVQPDLIPVRANHGHSNSFVEYAGGWIESNRAVLEDTIARLVAGNPSVAMSESGLEEIQANCRHVPKGLPSNKPLRVVRIGEGELVPCGGVHVAQVEEIGKIVINDIRSTPEGTHIIKYRVTRGDNEISERFA